MNILISVRLKTTCLVLLLTAVGIAHADVFNFSGTLDPATNPDLTYWDQLANGYAAPIPGPTDAERAFNIAVHTFPVFSAGPVNIASQGYGMGGFDAVVSVFEGTGNSAVYLGHEYSPFFPDDFSFVLNLGVGMHTLAVSVFGSEPCGAGLCAGFTGTFGDGFNNLVNFDQFSSLLYNVEVTTAPVPEPAPMGLMAMVMGVVAVLARRRFKR